MTRQKQGMFVILNTFKRRNRYLPSCRHYTEALISRVA